MTVALTDPPPNHSPLVASGPGCYLSGTTDGPAAPGDTVLVSFQWLGGVEAQNACEGRSADIGGGDTWLVLMGSFGSLATESPPAGALLTVQVSHISSAFVGRSSVTYTAALTWDPVGQLFQLTRYADLTTILNAVRVIRKTGGQR